MSKKKVYDWLYKLYGRAEQGRHQRQHCLDKSYNTSEHNVSTNLG